MKNFKKNPEAEDIETEEKQNIEEDAQDFKENEENEENDDIEHSEKYQTLLAENAQLKNDFLRAYADAENTKKRCAQEIEKNSKYAVSSFAKELLSVADNLHRAIASVSDVSSTECEGLLKGVEMTEAELTKVFNKFGIQKMEIIGTHFDPNYHQVIQEVEDKEKPAGTIIAELQTGYMINDRILREAMVVVSKGGK
ncbi:MAG: nucleotide exchange factor GrpE [Alphaproteobacteria bacterium]|nr:nucleotide exchange factor GrpE [Alphaproteobacteria bacterium]